MAPVFALIVYWGGWVFSAVIAAAAGLAMYEWYGLARRTPRFFVWLVLGVLYVWVSDSAAYFAGKLIGGPKMALEISPNKTWAGLAGATVVPGVVAVLWTQYISHIDNILMAFILGLVMGVVGQAGDLFISLVKRRAHVKDSGSLIPGHGGLLDRVDAMMLCAPVFLSIIAFDLYR